MRGIFERHKRPAAASAHHGAAGSSGQARGEPDLRGQVFHVGSHSVTVERKLAEGGFAIVYVVRCNAEPRRRYALKRQFTNDPRQLAACKREIEIIRTLNHRHIVRYVDSAVVRKDEDVYETMLLTHFYRHSVLELMNQRLVNGRWLRSREEVLGIFCDVCEAVARLHHSQTPVIHRDLKVENILMEDDGTFVLCDFGSATTKVLRAGSGGRDVAAVEEEVLRFTTLSYRSPEMIDLYAGVAMTTAVDVWALGVLLFKLAYFALPFGESALAIQNAQLAFPDQPQREPELKALIRYLLAPDPAHRPDIYQASAVAFHLAGRKLSIPNLRNAPVPRMAALVALLDEPPAADQPAKHKAPASSNAAANIAQPPMPQPAPVPQASVPLAQAEEKLVETAAPEPRRHHTSGGVTTTTVAPRLRPKASKGSTASPSTPGALPLPLPSGQTTPSGPPPSSTSDPDIAEHHRLPTSASLHQVTSPSQLGFADLEGPAASTPSSGDPGVLSPDDQRAVAALSISASAPHLPPEEGERPMFSTPSSAMTSSYHQTRTSKVGSVGAASGARFVPGHRRNVSDTSAVFSHGQHSAFRPYRSSQPDGLDKAPPAGLVIPPRRPERSATLPKPQPQAQPPPAAQQPPQPPQPLPKPTTPPTATLVEVPTPESGRASFNPFAGAPGFGGQSRDVDDDAFGQVFDALPRRRDSVSNDRWSSQGCSSDDDDEAPLAASEEPSPRTDEARDGGGALRSLATTIKSKRYRQLIDDDEDQHRDGSAASSSRLSVPAGEEDADSVGSASDLRLRMAADTSDDDEDHSDEEPRSHQAKVADTARLQPYDQLSSEGGLSEDGALRRRLDSHHSECEERAGELDALDDADDAADSIHARPLLEDNDDELTGSPPDGDVPLHGVLSSSESNATIKASDTTSATLTTPSAPRLSDSPDPFMSAPIGRGGAKTPTQDHPKFSLPQPEPMEQVVTPTAPAKPLPSTPSLATPSSAMPPPSQAPPPRTTSLHTSQPQPVAPAPSVPTHQPLPPRSLPRLPPPLVTAKPALPARSPLSPPGSAPLRPLPSLAQSPALPSPRPLVSPKRKTLGGPCLVQQSSTSSSDEEDVFSVGSAGSKVKARFKKASKGAKASARPGEDQMVLTSKAPDKKDKLRKSNKDSMKAKKDLHASNASLASKQSRRSRKSAKSGELSFVNSSFHAEDLEGGTSESGVE